MSASTAEFVCPECGYESDDAREWKVTFCPSYPDKCAGCEVYEGRLMCPECMHEWEIEDAR